MEGEPVVRVTVNWLMGEENLDPAWTFGPAGERYEMEVRGNPDFSVTVKGFQSGDRRGWPEGRNRRRRHRGALRELDPGGVRGRTGIATYLDLPLISGKAAPHLS